MSFKSARVTMEVIGTDGTSFTVIGDVVAANVSAGLTKGKVIHLDVYIEDLLQATVTPSAPAPDNPNWGLF
jgi:hypothetical protein